MVDDAFDRCGDGFESSVGVLGETGDLVAVIHAVISGGVEIVAVSWIGCFHCFVDGPRGILVFVVYAEEEGVGSGHWSRLNGFRAKDG